MTDSKYLNHVEIMNCAFGQREDDSGAPVFFMDRNTLEAKAVAFDPRGIHKPLTRLLIAAPIMYQRLSDLQYLLMQIETSCQNYGMVDLEAICRGHSDATSIVLSLATDGVKLAAAKINFEKNEKKA